MEKDYNLDIHGKPVNRTLLIVTILVGTFAGMLMQTSLGTALPALMKDFNIDLATAQQATTWFLLANGVMIPVSAYLSQRFSTKWIYWIAYGALAIGTALAAFAPTDNYLIFVIARVLQALSVGVTLPLMQMVMLSVYPPEERGKTLGLSGLVVGLAPAIGPTLAGWILEKNHTILGLTLSNSWRTIFTTVLVVNLIVFVISLFTIKDVLDNKKIKLDFLSLIYSSVGFALFLLSFNNVASDGWGNFQNVILPMIVGLVGIALFAMRQFKLEVPFLNLSVFKNKQFTLTTIAISLAMMAMMGVELVLPTYMQTVHGLSALNSGLSLLPGALMMGIVSPLAGAAYDKNGARPMALLGFAILLIGTVPLVFIGQDTPTLFITLLYGVRMFGIAMVFMPLTASAMSALSPNEVAHGTAANNTVRQVAASIAVAMLSSVTQNVINASKPADSLKDSDPINYGNDLINASLSGFHVSFLIAASFAIIGIILALFLRKGKVIAGQTSNNDESESSKGKESTDSKKVAVKAATSSTKKTSTAKTTKKAPVNKKTVAAKPKENKKATTSVKKSGAKKPATTAKRATTTSKSRAVKKTTSTSRAKTTRKAGK